MKTFILLITVMVQSEPNPATGERSVGVTIHSRDFLSMRECQDNRQIVKDDYKKEGYRRPSVVCLPRTGLEGDQLNEQDHTTQAAPSTFFPTKKLQNGDK